jgi:hypothetical protein
MRGTRAKAERRAGIRARGRRTMRLYKHEADSVGLVLDHMPRPRRAGGWRRASALSPNPVAVERAEQKRARRRARRLSEGRDL